MTFLARVELLCIDDRSSLLIATHRTTLQIYRIIISPIKVARLFVIAFSYPVAIILIHTLLTTIEFILKFKKF